MSLTDLALCSFSSLAPSLLLEKLWVQQWRGEESLSQPDRFEVRLATINPLFNDEALLGDRAVLTLSDDRGMPHPYHGIVTAVDYLDADTVYHYYRVVLARFIALPSDVQLRTPSVTPKPSVQGLLSAIVDGDESSTPLLNQHGRYKVSFPFIRGEKNTTRGSAWGRMATMSSGLHNAHNTIGRVSKPSQTKVMVFT